MKDLLESTESTDANRAALRRYVTETAPLAAPFITEDELAQVHTSIYIATDIEIEIDIEIETDIEVCRIHTHMQQPHTHADSTEALP